MAENIFGKKNRIIWVAVVILVLAALNDIVSARPTTPMMRGETSKSSYIGFDFGGINVQSLK